MKKRPETSTSKDELKKLIRLRWPRDRVRLKDVQELIKSLVDLKPLEAEPAVVAGVDAAFLGDKIVSTACVYTYPALECVERVWHAEGVEFPYIPGYLSFREGPAVVEAVEKLSTRPDLVLFDGQGIAHPRGLGIAAVVGVVLGIPSVGCGKSRLVGEYDEPGGEKGSQSPLVYKGDVVGSVVRTRTGVKPLFVSPGHLVDLAGAVEVTLGCATRYRLAEPVRCADRLSKRIKKEIIPDGGGE